jgi:mannosyltransferase
MSLPITLDTTEAPHAPESGRILPASDSGAAYYFALCAVLIARLWALPLRNGFWLDETGTVWALQGSLRDVMARCDIWPSQSPAYSFLDWFFYRLPGPHELLLRLPSFLAMCAAAYLLYKVAVRTVGPLGAWPAVIVFASIEPVAFAAADARPYAIAMLAVIGAMLMLVRWFDKGSPLDGLGFCLLASLSVYMHFVFGVTFLVYLVYGIFRARTEKRISVVRLCVAACVTGILLLPATFHLLAVLKTGHSFSFAGTPSGNDVFSMLAPSILVGSVLWLLFLGRLAKQRVEFRLPALNMASLVLLGSWALLPMGLLALLSATTSMKLFLPRYTLPSEAGLALLGGWVLSGIRPAWMRRVATTGLVAAVLLTAPSSKFAHGGDWRAAMAAVNSMNAKSQEPVLIRSGFVESEPFTWQDDPTRISYLFAPLTAYPSSAREIVRLPAQLNRASIAYLETLALERRDRFLLVGMGDTSYQNWLLGRLSAEGFEMKRIGSFGGSLVVEEYYRPSQSKSETHVTE